MKNKHFHQSRTKLTKSGGGGGKKPKKFEVFKERVAPTRVVGVLAKTPQGWNIQSTNRRERGEYILFVKGRDEHDLVEGHLAVGQITSKPSRYGPRTAKLLEVLGDLNNPKAVSMIAIATHEIPHGFDKETEAEAEAAKPVTLDSRVDLRQIPLVTIDGEDARDFDDAVFAEPHNDGWHLIVAIADVAHYVRSGGALDKTAYERGNSTYFPDRVVPMLPEALSNELCSLKPKVDRATLATHLWLDKEGELVRWEFVRGVMRSHARLTYNQVQRAIDGQLMIRRAHWLKRFSSHSTLLTKLYSMHVASAARLNSICQNAKLRSMTRGASRRSTFVNALTAIN